VAELRGQILRSQRERLVALAGTPFGRSWRFPVTRDATGLYPREAP